MHAKSLLAALAPCLVAAALPAQWTQSNPTTAPSPRSMVAMCYDLARNNTVVYGGDIGGQSGGTAQTWTYDGAAWTLRGPSAAPSARAECELVFDLQRMVGVLFGGYATGLGGRVYNQTWEWDGTNWTQANPTNSPDARLAFGAAYDFGRGRVVLYGGQRSPGAVVVLGDTWEYDGTNWTPIATPTSPGPLERASMCYDIARGRVLLFGGIDPQTGGTDDTWTYDGTTWSRLTIAGPKPAPRTGARMVYDNVRDVSILFGGHDPSTGAMIEDTWELRGGSWRQVAGGSPPGRAQFGMVMDLLRRRPVVFGGVSSAFTLNPLNDTLEYGADYRAFGAGCAGSNGVPTLGSTTVPRLGATFTANLGNLNPSSTVGVFVIGTSNSSASFGALPVDLSPLGLTGCTLFVSTDLLVPLAAAGGSATWTWIVPVNAGLLGAKLYNQGLGVDPGWNPAGLVLSNAAEAVLGV